MGVLAALTLALWEKDEGKAGAEPDIGASNRRHAFRTVGAGLAPARTTVVLSWKNGRGANRARRWPVPWSARPEAS